MAEACPYHIDHENRMKCLEDDMKQVQSQLGSPAVTVALVGLLGTIFSGMMAFLGVIFAPVLRVWFGL